VTENNRALAPDLQQCLEALKSERPALRYCAAELLGSLGDQNVVPSLIQTLSDEDYWVRKGAVEALARLGVSEAIPHLEQLCEDATTVCIDQRTLGDFAQLALETIRK
jgi:HEAT repeat protein